MAHYLFNVVERDAAPRERTAGLLWAKLWGVGADERHGNALAPGDLALIYLGAPHWELIGRAELASAVHNWTGSEARVYRGDSPRGVALAQVEEWDPPVPMSAVLAEIDTSEGAKADHEAGVVRITPHEYETALAVAAARAPAHR